MNENELRLGNYVMIHDYAKGNRQQVVEELGVCQVNLLHNEYCTPIPITKEWLLNFGFERVRDTSLYTKQTIEIDGTFEDYMEYNLEFKQVNLSYEMCSIPLQYVHELQNIYFALSKKELTIKE